MLFLSFRLCILLIIFMRSIFFKQETWYIIIKVDRHFCIVFYNLKRYSRSYTGFVYCLIFQVFEEACSNLLPSVLCDYLYTLAEIFTKKFYSNCQVYFWNSHLMLCIQIYTAFLFLFPSDEICIKLPSRILVVLFTVQHVKDKYYTSYWSLFCQVLADGLLNL